MAPGIAEVVSRWTGIPVTKMLTGEREKLLHLPQVLHERVVGQDEAVLDLAIGLPAAISSIVIGAWMVGVEFGQNTLRRVLSTDPRRTRLIFSKLAVCLIVIVGVTTALWLAGMLIFSLAGSGHETSIDTAQALRNGAAVLLSNVVYAVVAMGLAWITRSMAGGMTIAFVFFFVWIRATLPRLRYDQLMSFGWKVLLPLATLNTLVTAIVVVSV